MKDAKEIKQRLANINWQTVTEEIHAKGYAQAREDFIALRCATE